MANRKTPKKKDFKQMSCNPATKGKTVTKQSCFTPEVLLKIKQAYNDAHPDTPITTKNAVEIWTQLRENMSCEKERCWLDGLKDAQLKKQITDLAFAPDQPAEWKTDPDAWLSNHDISNVLRQYTALYPEFEIFGPTTIDFDYKPAEYGGQCVDQKICTFRLDSLLKRGKRKYGFVFNLDKYTGPGTHWVSMYVDVDAKVVFYFDSAGAPSVPIQVRELIDRIVAQGAKANIKFDVYDNAGKVHQHTNTECGMYSLFFIITMLTGEIPSQTPGGKPTRQSMAERITLFSKKRIPDKTVFDYRDLFFNA